MATLVCNQEAPQDQGFISYLHSLPEKTATTVRFFERSDYYTVHGSDAVFVAKEVFKTTSVVKMIGSGSQKSESVCLSRLNFESLLKDLLIFRRYRVEIYRNKGSGKSQEWSLEYKASPGNLTQLEEILFGCDGASVVDSKGVIAIRICPGNKEIVVAVAYGDPVLRQFTISEFNDDNSFSELEAVLVQFGPKECLLAPVGDQALSTEIKQIIKRNNILLTECKAGDFNTKDILQDLDRLIKIKETAGLRVSMLNETDLKIAVSGIAALIKYFELLADESNFGQYSLSTYNSKQHMKLDMAAVKALGLFPLSPEGSKNHSLLGLLNRCRTSQGQRLLNQWIKQPLMDVKKIDERLDIVESFISDTELRHALHENYLRKMLDLQMLSKKFQKKKADLQDLYRVYMMLEQLPYLHNCLMKHDGPYAAAIQATFCVDINDRLDDFKTYQEMVKTVLDFEAVANGEFIVKSDMDPELQKLRELMKTSQELISAEIDKVARDLGLEANKTVKLENCRQIGYYFRVTRKEEKALRNKKNYITIDTKQSGVRFYNPSLRNLNDKYLSVRKSYEDYQNEIVEKVVDVASSYCLPMKQLSDTISHLDVLVAFASTAFHAPKPYVRPKITPKGQNGIMLKQARHPCLEVQPNIDFIPNDIEMKKEHQMLHIITGPNMGGKSTFIRAVALNVLMAQIGSFVPCDAAEISIVDAILTRVGAGDRPMKGVSTFMAEMLEIKHILKAATCDSLIIVDELGRGTSTYDGLGLAWAISEYIVKTLNSYCLFTTHFHELAALSDEIETVNNLHVTAVTSDENITFLYKVKPGVCDQSFGIHVAEMAHFPKDVIEYAKEKVKELEEFERSKFTSSSDMECSERKQKFVIEEAEKIAEDFLKKISEVINDSNSNAMAMLEELKKELKSVPNEHIQDLIAKYSVNSVS